MDKNNNWQDISDDISDLSKKIKANLFPSTMGPNPLIWPVNYHFF